MKNSCQKINNIVDDMERIRKSNDRVSVTFSPLGLLLTTASFISASWGLGILLRQDNREAIALLAESTLPIPLLPHGKTAPLYQYTAKDFAAVFSKRKIDVHLDGKSSEQASMTAEDPVTKECTLNSTPHGFSEEEEEQEEHFPAGQHLLVDIKHVSSNFLSSMEELAEKMIALVNLSQLTLLSYHCHDLEGGGVSCAGVLLESHVALHTWPSAGAIVLDLFTCGPNSLLPMVDIVQDLFAISSPNPELPSPKLKWSHKNRGFQENANPEEVSFEHFLVGWSGLQIKDHMVVSAETDFQTVDVFEVSSTELPSNAPSLNIESEEQVRDKVVFLDKVMQSNRFGMEAYHEALVHPAMITHNHPKRVAIIGGGEGATLREVLKHKTVEKCVMVEIDYGMVNLSREYLPEWSDCSFLTGNTVSCFDDPRTEVHYMDAYQWFIDHFLDADQVDEMDKFDVVIMDALDPSSEVEFSDKLYGDFDFLSSIKNSLTTSGILVAQVGMSVAHNDPMRTFLPSGPQLEIFERVLEELDYDAMALYTEFHGRFDAPWEFRIVFADDKGWTNWLTSEAAVNARIAQRSMALRYFDGATMMEYQYPSRVVEDVYCRGGYSYNAQCFKGHGFDLYTPQVPISALEVKKSTIAGAGFGVFFKRDFERGSYVAAEDGVHSMLIGPHVYQILLPMDSNEAYGSRWRMWLPYMNAYGFRSSFYGGEAFLVDPGIGTFFNHGCNATFNMGSQLEVTEMTADPEVLPPSMEEDPYESTFFDVFGQRNHFSYQAAGDGLVRDVVLGEEVLDNYLSHYSYDNWGVMTVAMKAKCLQLSETKASVYDTKSEVFD